MSIIQRGWLPTRESERQTEGHPGLMRRCRRHRKVAPPFLFGHPAWDPNTKLSPNLLVTVLSPPFCEPDSRFSKPLAKWALKLSTPQVVACVINKLEFLTSWATWTSGVPINLSRNYHLYNGGKSPHAILLLWTLFIYDWLVSFNSDRLKIHLISAQICRKIEWFSP